VGRLTAEGFEVSDHGDCALHAFQPDQEHPRARNVAQVLAVLEELRPKIEVAVKSGALPLILGGDDSVVLAAIAGTRRYYRNVGLIDMDRDAGLNVPATTPSGCVDGMVISHVIGRGAPELVRFWGEPPLVRQPDVALFGVERLDLPEQEFLQGATLRRYMAADISRMGAAAAAEHALEGMHGRTREFILQVDLDVISGEDFRATNLSAPGGLAINEVRAALAAFARQPTLAALSICAYNPDLDTDGSAAQQIINLLVEILSSRLEPASETAPAAGEAPRSEEAPLTGAPVEPAPAETPAIASEPAQPDESSAPASESDTTSN
jgi:arginase